MTTVLQTNQRLQNLTSIAERSLDNAG